MKIRLLLTTVGILLHIAMACAVVADEPVPCTTQKSFEAVDYRHRTICHSPEKPGYTCWAQLWGMSDGSLMVTLTQATGPVQGRKRAPAEILHRMPSANQNIAGYDMTGLNLENVYLHSSNDGKTWEKVGSEPFASCMNSMLGGGIVTLANGSMLRNVWGQGLRGQDRVYADVLETGFLQRSSDGAKTWSKPEWISQDPKLQTWPKRLRRLRDGRILITGGACPYESDKWKWEEQCTKIRPCLWVSKDPAGKSWTEPLYVGPSGTEEWDVAELDNGDLIGVLRIQANQRRQVLLVKHGETWKPGPLEATPFPPSGQPELVATREGVVLYVDSNGSWWTANGGKTWTKLSVPGSAYYPSAVQITDGTILVVSHVGNDNAYGTVDQSIVLDSFKLKVR
jgi:hypothetical protein